jgi:hypothetical protein
MTWIGLPHGSARFPAGLPRADAGVALLGWCDDFHIQQEHTMNNRNRQTDPAAKGPNVLHEADIGSGEKSPGELETEAMIREIPPLPPSGKPGEESTGTANKS